MKNIVCFLLLMFLYESKVLAYELKCEELADTIYAQFKNYRNDVNKIDTNLSKYFSVTGMKQYGITVNKNDISEKDKIKREQYLKTGNQVKIVYDYDLHCLTKGKVDLLIYADSYQTLTQSKVRDSRTVVTVRYIKESMGWKIYHFVFDNRDNAKSKVIRNDVVDMFK